MEQSSRHRPRYEGEGRTAQPDGPAVRRPPTADRAELVALVARAAADDAPAQAELVRRYTRRIAGLIRSVVRETESVEDVTQIVFIKMFRRLARLRDPQVFEPWLFTLARNTAIDQVRRRRCRPSMVALTESSPQIVDEYQPQRYDEIVAVVERALLRLGPVDRRLVSMAVTGESYRAMATQTGLSLATVKIRLHRVRPFLRQWVGSMTGLRHPGDRGWRASARSRVAA